MIKGILVLAVYALCSSSGLALLKMSLKNSSPILPSLLKDWHFWIGTVLYGTGFLIWLALLKLNNLSTIFASAAGSLVVVTAITGCVLLDEPVSIKMVIGLLLIVTGICCVAE